MKLYVILAEGQYHDDIWIARIYTSLDKAKEFLEVNYKYWWENRPDLSPEEFAESVESIQNITDNDLDSQGDFFVDLTHAGMKYTLSIEQTDEPVEVV